MDAPLLFARRLRDDESGQDLVEYALLTSFFTLCALAMWPGIRDAIGASQGSAQAGARNDLLFNEPPAPTP